jgi:hypothetical protein
VAGGAAGLIDRGGARSIGSGILGNIHHEEAGMPLYRVWYRNNEDPLEFATPGRSSEAEILDQILEHERIERGAPATVQELIARHNLAPVRYTEDESEMNPIG